MAKGLYEKDVLQTAAGAAVDAAARRVTSRGVDFVPHLRTDKTLWRSDIRPKVRQPLRGQLDLTGQRFGRLVVIGLSARAKKNNNAPAGWVVRCDCGWFEERTAKALRRGCDREELNNNVACSECGYVAQMIAGHALSPDERLLKRITGKAPDTFTPPKPPRRHL